MKYYKRAELYKAANVQFNPKTKQAYSYGWWRFVDVVEGKVVFNNYFYSNSTSKHQSKVRNLMESLGIKIDLTLPIPRGLQHSEKLSDLILVAEEYLCEKYLMDQLKAQDRYERAKRRKFERKLEQYLENEVHFRDYEIKPRSQFGTYNKIAVHQVVEKESLERDVENALYNFQRDGFSNVVFYV